MFLSVTSVAVVYTQDIIEQLIDIMLSNVKSKKRIIVIASSA